jgi:toxin HigB-1
VPIKSFKHKGLEKFFVSESKGGIQPAHASKLKRLLGRLNVSTKPEDMNLPGFGFHGLQGQKAGRFAVSVNGNWRVTFEFDGTDAVVVDYEDYH